MALVAPKLAASAQLPAPEPGSVTNSEDPLKTWNPLIVPRELYIREGLAWQSHQPVSLTVEVNGKRDMMKYAAVMQLVNKLGYVVRLGQPGAAAKFQNLHLIDVKRRGSTDIHIILGDLAWAQSRASEASTAAAPARTPTQPPSGVSSPDLPESGVSEACILAAGGTDGAMLSGSSSEGTSLQAGAHSVATAAAAAAAVVAAAAATELDAGTSTDSRSPADVGVDQDDKATGTSDAHNGDAPMSSSVAPPSVLAGPVAFASVSASASVSAAAIATASVSASASGAASAAGAGSAALAAAPVGSLSAGGQPSLLCSCAFCPCHFDSGLLDMQCNDRSYGDVSPHGSFAIIDHQVCYGSRSTPGSSRPPAQPPGLPSRLSSPPIPLVIDVAHAPAVGHVSHISRERLRNLCLPGLMRASPQVATGAKATASACAAAASCGAVPCSRDPAHMSSSAPTPLDGEVAPALPARNTRGAIMGGEALLTRPWRQSGPAPQSAPESGSAPAAPGDLIGWELVMPPELAAKRAGDKVALVRYEIDGDTEDCKMQYRVVQLDDGHTAALQGVSRPLRGLQLVSLGETSEGDLFIRARTPGPRQDDGSLPAASPKPTPPALSTAPPVTAAPATGPDNGVLLSRSSSGRQRRPSLKAREEAAAASGAQPAAIVGGSLVPTSNARAVPASGGAFPAPMLPPLYPVHSGQVGAASAAPAGSELLLTLPSALPPGPQLQRRRGRPPRARAPASLARLAAQHLEGDGEEDFSAAAVVADGDGDVQMQEDGRAGYEGPGRCAFGTVGTVAVATAKRARVGDRRAAGAATGPLVSHFDGGCGRRLATYRQQDPTVHVYQHGEGSEGRWAGSFSPYRRNSPAGPTLQPSNFNSDTGAAAAVAGFAAASAAQRAAATHSGRLRRASNTGAVAAAAAAAIPLSLRQDGDASAASAGMEAVGSYGAMAPGGDTAGDSPSRNRSGRKRSVSGGAYGGSPEPAAPSSKRARASDEVLGPWVMYQRSNGTCSGSVIVQQPGLGVARSAAAASAAEGTTAATDIDGPPVAAAPHGMRARHPARAAYRLELAASSCPSVSSSEGSDDRAGQAGDEPSSSGEGLAEGRELDEGGSAAAHSGAIASSSLVAPDGGAGSPAQQGRPKPRCRANAGKSKSKPIRHPSKITNVVRNAGAILLMIGRNPLMYEKQLRATFGNNPDTSKALRLLEEQGKVLRGGLGYRMHPYHYTLTMVGIEEYERQLRDQGPSYAFALSMGVQLPPAGGLPPAKATATGATDEGPRFGAAAAVGASGVEPCLEVAVGDAAAGAEPSAVAVRLSAFANPVCNDEAAAAGTNVAAAAVAAAAPAALATVPMDGGVDDAVGKAATATAPAAGGCPESLGAFNKQMERQLLVLHGEHSSGGLTASAAAAAAGAASASGRGATTCSVAASQRPSMSISGNHDETEQQPYDAATATAALAHCPPSAADPVCTAAPGRSPAAAAVSATWAIGSPFRARSAAAQSGSEPSNVQHGGSGGGGGAAEGLGAGSLGRCPSPVCATAGAIAALVHRQPQPQSALEAGTAGMVMEGAEAGGTAQPLPNTAGAMAATATTTATPSASSPTVTAAYLQPQAAPAPAMYGMPQPAAFPLPYPQQLAYQQTTSLPLPDAVKQGADAGPETGILPPYGNPYALYGYVPTPFGYVPVTMYNAYASDASTAATVVGGGTGPAPGAAHAPFVLPTVPVCKSPPGALAQLQAPVGVAAGQQPATAPGQLCAASFVNPFPLLTFAALPPGVPPAPGAIATLDTALQPALPQGMPTQMPLLPPPQLQPQPQPHLKVEGLEALAVAPSQPLVPILAPAPAETATVHMRSQVGPDVRLHPLDSHPPPPLLPAFAQVATTSATGPTITAQQPPAAAALAAAPQFCFVVEMPGAGNYRAEVPGTDGRVYYSPGFSDAMQAAAAADLLLCKLRPGERLNLGISPQEEVSLASMSVEQVQAMLWSMSDQV